MADEAQGEKPAAPAQDEIPAGSKEALLADLAKERDRRQAAEKAAKENKDAARKLAELEDAQKTEQQRLTDRAEKAESKASDLERDNLRLRVAIESAVPEELRPTVQLFADRLRGDTEDELRADVENLLPLVSTQGKRTPAPDPSQGRRTQGDTSTASQFASAVEGLLPR
jgi:hypothetical protein